jgi:hypothetical protein
VDYLQTDDTSVTAVDERGGSFKGRIWTYLDSLTKQVVFDATPRPRRVESGAPDALRRPAEDEPPPRSAPVPSRVSGV